MMKKNGNGDDKRQSAKKGTEEFASNLGERIAQVAEYVGGKKKLARQLGTYESNIYRYINGETSISARMLVDIAKVGNINVDWLATGDGDVPDFDEKPGARRRSAEGLTDSFIKLPRYEIGSDDPDEIIATSLQIVDFLSFKKSWLSKELGLNPEQIAVIVASDDAMHPTISKDDLVLVDLSRNNVAVSGLYVLSLNESLVVRRIQISIGGDLELRNDNPHYAPERVPKEAIDDLRVLGRAVWTGRKLS